MIAIPPAGPRLQTIRNRTHGYSPVDSQSLRKEYRPPSTARKRKDELQRERQVKLDFEALEDRMLMSVLYSGTTSLLIDTDATTTPNTMTMTVAKTGADEIQVSLVNDTWLLSGAPPSGVTDNGLGTLTIDTTALTGSITIQNTDGENFAINFAGGGSSFVNDFVVNISTGTVPIDFNTDSEHLRGRFRCLLHHHGQHYPDGAAVSVTNGLTLSTTGNIDLNNGSNNFSSVTVVAGNNVTLADTDALVLGTSNVTTSLAVTAGGAVAQERRDLRLDRRQRYAAAPGHIDAHFEESVAEIQRYLRQPGISTTGEGIRDERRAVQGIDGKRWCDRHRIGGNRRQPGGVRAHQLQSP